ncbi:hypothetical protein EZ313_04755 [Ramlibacter henchirensis]|uniref:Uncharacterized protein n=1 Tax=Ramlibacter henchirensis TaxID=204072 RepID=A0A4Z0C7A1_9BURK|nr:hypothetical protein [Ramlibacter henchirensis]TFZ05965.1 hypothetical protein EZ313_04755 [Ramlibacter henchirensis]
MVLQSHTPYPQARSYVLRLHRDCDPAEGRLHGRIEHLVSGSGVEFSSAQDLVDWLRSHAAAGTSSCPRSSS